MKENRSEQERKRQKSHKQKKVAKYRKPINLNIGLILFALILVYVIYEIVAFYKTGSVTPYEVREGSLASENIYTGIAIRDERIIKARTAGYVDFFAKEGTRVAVGDMVCALDETGKLKDYLAQNDDDEHSLSSEQLKNLRTDIVNYVRKFDAENFETVYDFKEELASTIAREATAGITSAIGSMGSDILSDVSFMYAPNTGIVAYWTDGYEQKSVKDLTPEDFKEENYVRENIEVSQLLTEGEPVFKYCNDETWYIAIETDTGKANELSEAEYVKVRFMENQEESWGHVTNRYLCDDDKEIVELSFNNSMVRYCKERFVEIELLLHDETGLKIPNSAIVTKEFYLIPESFVTQSGDTNSFGVLKEAVLEDGTPTTEYQEISIYSQDGEDYYVDASALKSGVHLIKTDSTETYTVSRRATRIGVYNINKGYAEFRQIEILYQNDDYAIVRSNTEYGLNVYDLIIENASHVTDDQFIYE